MKTLRLVKKENNSLIPSEYRDTVFYPYKDGLFLIGDTDKEIKTFIEHPILMQLFQFFDYEIVDALVVKETMEQVEWDIFDFSSKPPYSYFNLLYKKGD